MKANNFLLLQQLTRCYAEHNQKTKIIMKIALIGYGKMGKTIEEIAIANGDKWC
jgi:hypothetical protein